MNQVFNNSSWEVEDEKNGTNTFNFEKNLSEDLKLKYLNPIFFDNLVRIDLIVEGNLKIFLNDIEYEINSSNKSNKCLKINNWKIECGNDKITIPKSENQVLKVILNKNTKVNKFTIIQDLNINNCNPNN